MNITNIPSITVQTKGMKLLEKVEELTLYMIELKKQNDFFQQRIEKLETESRKK